MASVGIDEWFVRRWSGTVADLRAWWNTNTKHGCFCGAGEDCFDPIDGLDTCCHQHDLDYEAVGVSADTMWSREGFVLTIDADWALSECAECWECGDVDASDPKSNPDPHGYRDRLIWLFSTRAGIGEWIRAATEAEWNFREWLDGVKDWLLSSAETPAEIRDGFAQHAAYLASLGIEPDEIGGVVRDTGVQVASLAGDGFDVSNVA